MNMKSNVHLADDSCFKFHPFLCFLSHLSTLFPQAIKQYFYIYYLLINGAVFIILPYC